MTSLNSYIIVLIRACRTFILKWESKQSPEKRYVFYQLHNQTVILHPLKMCYFDGQFYSTFKYKIIDHTSTYFLLQASSRRKITSQVKEKKWRNREIQGNTAELNSKGCGTQKKKSGLKRLSRRFKVGKMWYQLIGFPSIYHRFTLDFNFIQPPS